MKNDRLSTLLAGVGALVLFFIVSGVGPVFLWNLYTIVGVAAVIAIASTAIYPRITATAVVWGGALYPYFLSHCSDVYQTGGSTGGINSLLTGFPCLLSRGDSLLSILLVGVPGTLIYGIPLAMLSYFVATQLNSRLEYCEVPA